MNERPSWDDLDDADSLLSKREFVELTGLAPRQVDALVRAGAPAIAGASTRAGYSFELKPVMAWLMRQYESPADPLAEIKQRRAALELKRAERADRMEAGELADLDDVKANIAEGIARFRSRLLDIPARLTAQSDEVRRDVGNEIASAFEDLERDLEK